MKPKFIIKNGRFLKREKLAKVIQIGFRWWDIYRARSLYEIGAENSLLILSWKCVFYSQTPLMHFFHPLLFLLLIHHLLRRISPNFLHLPRKLFFLHPIIILLFIGEGSYKWEIIFDTFLEIVNLCMEFLTLMHIFDRDQIFAIFFSYEAKTPIAINFGALLGYPTFLQGQCLLHTRLLQLGNHQSHIFTEGSIDVEIACMPNWENTWISLDEAGVG